MKGTECERLECGDQLNFLVTAEMLKELVKISSGLLLDIESSCMVLSEIAPHNGSSGTLIK